MLVTTTQPQLFPPLYLYSRFARADTLIFLTRTQHNRGQYMSECLFQVPGDKRTTGVGMSISKTGRAGTHECELANELFTTDCQRVINQYPNAEYVQQALDHLQQTYVHRQSLNHAVICCLNTSMRVLGYDKPLVLDGSLPVDRQNASSYIADLTRAVGGTQYFQGKTAMTDYIQTEYFDDIQLGFQEYQQPDVDKNFSVLHYIASNGLDWVKDRIRPELSVIYPFSRTNV